MLRELSCEGISIGVESGNAELRHRRERRTTRPGEGRPHRHRDDGTGHGAAAAQIGAERAGLDLEKATP